MNRAFPLLLSGLLSLPAAAEEPQFTLVIQGHRFEPAELRVPAGTKIKLTVENRDSTPQEFESHELNREKVIPGNSKASIYVGPLKPGRYPFFGEFNPVSARGALIAE